MLIRTKLAAAGATAVLALLGATPALSLTSGNDSLVCPQGWSMSGRELTHSSSVPVECTGIAPGNVSTLAPKWFLHTTDSVTASPVVVGNTLYVGSWDGRFYAVDTESGHARWTFDIRTTVPTAFGRIVSTASVQPFIDPTAPGGKRLVVVFGGGSSVWALDATTGRELAMVDLDPRDVAMRKAQAADPPVVEVESSPAVADVRVGGRLERRIYVGFDVHNREHVGRTGLVSLRLDRLPSGAWSFTPVWKLDPETGQVYPGAAGLTIGSGGGWGCGGVWSSPAVDTTTGLVYFGTASCDNPEEAIRDGENFAEEMIAARADSGQITWSFRPGKTAADADLDDDFGASPNIFTTVRGKRVAGEGRKDGCYYARDAATGQYAWRTCVGNPGNLSKGFAVGGYLGTTAVQTNAHGRALRVIGASAIPVPHSAGEAVKSTIAVRALDAETGRMLWVYRLDGPSYGSTSVAGNVAFVPDTVTSSLLALDARLGVPLAKLPVIGPPSSTPAVVGDSVYLTTGTRETDLEYKAFDHRLQNAATAPTGESPLSPLSGIYRFALPSPASGG